MVGFKSALIGGIAAQAAVVACQTTPLTGSHTDIPRWCGKPYEVGAPNFDPGGQLSPPAPQPSDLLFVNVAPRHSIFVSSESKAELIVDASLSRYHGQSFSNTSTPGRAFDTLHFSVREDATNQTLLAASVPVNTTGNLFFISLSGWTPRMSPYQLTLTGGPTADSTAFRARAALYYLPAKTNGSMVKMDYLHGGMLYANAATNFTFEPVLPFGFYTDCSSYLVSAANASAYAALGFTAINPVCALPDGGNVSAIFTWLDDLNVLFQYDMRNSYYNLSSVAAQVEQMKDHAGLLSWYTADEPDGWEYAFHSTTAAYDLLRALDPYHPTGLVLNCANYYFDEYTRGADYVMEDAYPVGINATWSYRGTPCNATYGDCGCDDCMGELTDVRDRLDAFRSYQDWLGRAAPQKLPLWAVQQAFAGEGYWARLPTVAETHVMNVLAFNHGAKGVMSWLFPSVDEALNQAHGALARVATVEPVRPFLLGGQPTGVQVEGWSGLDVAYWMLGKHALVGLANVQNGTVNGTVRVPLGEGLSVVGLVGQPWGELAWTVAGGRLELEGVPPLGTSLVIVCTGN